MTTPINLTEHGDLHTPPYDLKAYRELAESWDDPIALALIDTAEAAIAYAAGTLPLDPRIDHPVERRFRDTLTRYTTNQP